MFISAKAQLANYVNNGSFENLYNCQLPTSAADSTVKFWRSINVTQTAFGTFNTCLQNVPITGVGFQYPRTGNGFVRGTFLCDINFCDPINNRNYFRNELKMHLKANTIYCVKFYVNIINISQSGIDGIGAYFGDSSLDTIKHDMVPLTYLTPQVQNPSGYIITDTLNWVKVTGTFIATGNEKFMVIGNFKSDANTLSTQIQPTISFSACDLNLDDVSCIPLDLPAFAGHDTSFIPGSSIYLGRQRDVGIDEACMWYKLPIVITPTTPAIDTAAGIWINPITTSTYVVRQEICGNVKWDTVIVYQTALGIAPLSLGEGMGVRLYPNPSNESLNITSSVDNGLYEATIYNAFGQMLREEEIVFKNKTATIKTDDLENGVYVLRLSNKTQTVSKRFIINK